LPELAVAEVTVSRSPLTDVGNAERFIARHGANVRYVPAWDRFLTWKGMRWRVDDLGEVYQLAIDTVKSVSREEALQTDDTAMRADLANHGKQSEREPRVTALLKIARTYPALVRRPEDFDVDPLLLGTSNGVIDLRRAYLREALREDAITKFCGAPWDPTAEAPRWMQFLSEIFAGNEELVEYVQTAVGYSLTALTTEHTFWFCWGPGANGKTVFLNILRAILGDYAAMADAASFMEKRNDGPRSDLARLDGARLVVASETGENRRLAESIIKQLTGGDFIVARRLYQAEFEFRPKLKLWLISNHKPVIRGTDVAIWRRVHLIPFSVVIPEEKRDLELENSLRHELPGILRWAVAGCQLWLERGLKAPEAVRSATEEYRQESDTLGTFLEERCDLVADGSTPAKELHAAYTRWAEDAREPPLTATMFGRKLTERGIPSEKVGRGTKHRIGIRLLPQLSEPSENGSQPASADSCGQLDPVSKKSLYARAQGESPAKGSELSELSATPLFEGATT
jgi:putative DNA primase/helicase